jgi:transcriptional regulator with XRE-family HTH domain
MAKPKPKPDDDLVDYDGFAAIAGLSPASLRTYATSETKKAALGFPEPVGVSADRKKLFRRADAEAWQKRRVEHSSPNRGRPLQGPGGAAPRVRLTEDQARAVQARLKAAKVSTIEAAKVAGITRSALNMRYLGKSGWQKRELQAIAKRLGTTYRDLTKPIDEDGARRLQIAAEREKLQAERARLEQRLLELDAELER